jgi:hypothetical protein
MTEVLPALEKLDNKQLFMSAVTFTTMLKAFSMTSLKYIKASPYQLKAIADNIENTAYIPGLNDCHSWFLRALSKLQEYELADKEADQMLTDAMKSYIGMFFRTGTEFSSSIGRAVPEYLNAAIEADENGDGITTALANGFGNLAHSIIKGCSAVPNACIDSTAGVVANVAGLVSRGGCATKRGLIADIADLEDSVKCGQVNPSHAATKTVGLIVGNVGYGVSNTVQNGLNGVTDTASGIVKGTLNILPDTSHLVGDEFRNASDSKNPALMKTLVVLATPGIVVGSVAYGIGKTGVNTVVNVGKTVEGVFKGIGSIFKN